MLADLYGIFISVCSSDTSTKVTRGKLGLHMPSTLKQRAFYVKQHEEISNAKRLHDALYLHFIFIITVFFLVYLYVQSYPYNKIK